MMEEISVNLRKKLAKREKVSYNNFELSSSKESLWTQPTF
jgi:hypothetical protein